MVTAAYAPAVAATIGAVIVVGYWPALAVAFRRGWV